jgi:predicted DNA-binding protein
VRPREGVAAVTEEVLVQVSLRVPKALKDELDRLAKKHGRERAALARLALEEGLRQMTDDPKLAERVQEAKRGPKPKKKRGRSE